MNEGINMSAESAFEKQNSTMPWASILIAGIASIVASMVANLIVRSIAIRIFDIPGGFDPLATAGPVVMASITYGFVATIAFIITRRFAKNPARSWLLVGLVGLIISFIPPLGLLSQDDSSGVGVAILLVMHAVAAAIFIPTMLRIARD